MLPSTHCVPVEPIAHARLRSVAFSLTPEGTIVIAVRLYAAYGSNLDPGRMRAYCPHSPLVGTGWLEGGG